MVGNKVTQKINLFVSDWKKIIVFRWSQLFKFATSFCRKWIFYKFSYSAFILLGTSVFYSYSYTILPTDSWSSSPWILFQYSVLSIFVYSADMSVSTIQLCISALIFPQSLISTFWIISNNVVFSGNLSKTF